MARTPLTIDIAKVEQLAEDGYTDMDIARQCGFSQDTLIRRKKDNADFAAAIQRGRERSHGVVANALFKQAKRGNVAAIVWYEKTRRGFTDRTATDVTTNGQPLPAPPLIDVTAVVATLQRAGALPLPEGADAGE